MKTLYLDLFSGISGDMFLGALIDLGVDAHRLERQLKKLKLGGYTLHASRRHKSGIEGVKFDVQLTDTHSQHDDHRHQQHERANANDHRDRRFSEIERLISLSKLSRWVKKKSAAVFRRIAHAEGRIHGISPERVHFHEVGAVDSIVDIVGASIALEMLGKPRVLASPVVEGVGWVDCVHGRYPVPTPATLAILGARGIGVTQCDEPHELVTPTGAALLAEFAESFAPMSGFVAEKVGFGLGKRDNKNRANVLRAVLGKTAKKTSNLQAPTANNDRHDWQTDTVAVLETNVDDISGEILGHFAERALAAGALDVFHTPIQMKKNRPGVLLAVLCTRAEVDKFAELILRETSAFGVRCTLAERRTLRREFKSVKTPFGTVKVKIGTLNGHVLHTAPEYEACKKLAAPAKVTLKQIYEAAMKALNR